MFKVLEECCTPKRGTKFSAYVDLFAREDVVIGAGETKVVKLGVKLDMGSLKNKFMWADWEHFLKSHYLEVALRSSLAVKGLIIANGIGIIDLDYPDEIGLIVHNPLQSKEIVRNWQNYTVLVDNDDYEFRISKGDKVAQCTLKEHNGFLLGYETETLRVSGFGSTGAV